MRSGTSERTPPGRSFDAPPGPVVDRTVLWSSDFETGDTSQWYFPDVAAHGNEGGGEFDSGPAASAVSTDYAHSGIWSLKMTIAAPPESGTRMFRWLESHTYNDLYYSAWYYFPQNYWVVNPDTVGYWDIFQWKSRSASGRVDPVFVLNVGNRDDGTMYLYLRDWRSRSYFQALKNVPVGQWFNITARYVCAGDNTGHVTFWQDSDLLFDVPNVQTRYPDGDCGWSVNNYSSGMIPVPTVLYIDDAEIFVPSGSLIGVNTHQ